MVYFSVTGVDRLHAELERRMLTVEARARRLVEDYGEHVRGLTFQLSPVDTGFMREHVGAETSEGDGVFGFEAGWRAEEFRNEGFAPYYLFQEFGTVFMAPQPSLGPAWNELRPHFMDDAADILNTMARV